MGWGFLIAVAVVLALVYACRHAIRREVVSEFEYALRYRDGSLTGELPTGAHWMTFRDEVTRIDKRPELLVLSGQEILTKDRIAVKISLVIAYAASDPKEIVSGSLYPDMALSEAARLALRRVVADFTVDELLEARSDLGERLSAELMEPFETLGFALSSVAPRDIMLPNNLKRAYASVLEAKKDAERRLEHARGEQAVMRSLANAARTLEKNPALVQARMLQALDGGGNTIVFGAGGLAGLDNPTDGGENTKG